MKTIKSRRWFQQNATHRDLRAVGVDLSGLALGNVYYCEFVNCNLRGTVFHTIDYCTFTGCQTRGVDLSMAVWYGGKPPAWVYNKLRRTPKSGAFIGWKKCVIRGGGYAIVELEIPADAKRLDAVTGNERHKCRCSHAKVLSITSLKTGKKLQQAFSERRRGRIRTTYRVGETVRCHEYDPGIEAVCSGGIHFFMTREQAENYWFN